MKVLLISHNPFSKTQNNGKTLEAIFQDYSKDDICQLYFSELIPDVNFCDRYFRITDKEVLLNSISCKKSRFTNNFSLKKTECLKPNFTSLFKNKIKQMPFIRDGIWRLGGWKCKGLYDWIKKNRPDYIFFVAGQFHFSHYIARYLSDKYKIPLVIYFTDDYLINPIERNIIDKIEKKRMKKFYTESINHASLCFAIGSKMASVYEDYFNKKFYHIMNMVPLNQKLKSESHEDIIISYFGGLHLNRWKQISKLGNVIKNICYEGKKVKLYVYSTPPNDEILVHFNKACVEYKGFVSSENMASELSKSDILLHVESDDDYYKSLTKLSVSTKLPEYISTGRCVLGFGPLEVASMQLLSENQIGYVISSTLNENEISNQLRILISNINLRKELQTSAYNFALVNFNPCKIREDFNKQIRMLLNM